ncbi:MAG: hypothetical protein DSY57_04125 [Desulfobulbus sp.]|nr:MAG: hypothetical protein DSY57_04125 [Desulfobulbus sp.]
MKVVSFCRVLFVCSFVFFLAGCSGTQNSGSSQPPAAENNGQSEVVQKLAKRYDRAFVAPFTIAPEYGKDYPGAAATLQRSMVEGLKAGKKFSRVETLNRKKPVTGRALIVKANITKLRIASTSARFWGGPFAGSSGIELELQLIDGATGKVVRTKKMSSWNNSWAASWNFGASDRSLLDDVGKIMAEYILQTIPEQ